MVQGEQLQEVETFRSNLGNLYVHFSDEQAAELNLPSGIVVLGLAGLSAVLEEWGWWYLHPSELPEDDPDSSQTIYDQLGKIYVGEEARIKDEVRARASKVTPLTLL